DSTTRLVGPVGNSHYDSLQLSLERRFSAGYQLQASYTWSKCISIAGIGNSGDAPAIPIPEFFNLNRSLCSIDTPHNLEVGGIFELPFGRGKRWATGGGLGAALLGAWQINTLFSSYSGNPFTVGTSGASLNAPFNSQRADLVKPNVRKLGGVGPGQAF